MEKASVGNLDSFVHLLDLNPARESPVKLDGFAVKGIKKIEFVLDSDNPYPCFAYLNLRLLVKITPEPSGELKDTPNPSKLQCGYQPTTGSDDSVSSPPNCGSAVSSTPPLNCETGFDPSLPK